MFVVYQIYILGSNVCFFHITRQYFNSQQCPLIPQVSVRYHRLRVQSHNTTPQCSPFQMPIGGFICYLCFLPTGYKQEVSKISFLSIVNLLEWHVELREAFTCVCQFITKGTEQLDEKVCRVRSRRDLNKELRFSRRLDYTTVQCMDVFWLTRPGSSMKPPLLGYMETSLHRHD